MQQELLLLVLLGVFAYQDYKRKVVNLRLLIAGGAFGVFLQIVVGQCVMPDVLSGVWIGVTVCLISVLTKGIIGIGDGAVLILSGLLLGFWKNIEICMIAAYLAGMAALVLYIVKKRGRKDRIAFIPFLLTAYVLTLLY